MSIKCPEHDKLKALGGANQIVGDFIEWLGEQGYSICEFNGKSFQGEYLPVSASRDKLIAQHFEIDPEKLEAEKVAMLDEIRARPAMTELPTMQAPPPRRCTCDAMPGSGECKVHG